MQKVRDKLYKTKRIFLLGVALPIFTNSIFITLWHIDTLIEKQKRKKKKSQIKLSILVWKLNVYSVKL